MIYVGSISVQESFGIKQHSGLRIFFADILFVAVATHIFTDRISRMSNTYRYGIVEYDHGVDDGYKVETSWHLDDEALGYIAEDAAEDFYNNCDGWESEWPLTFIIWDNDGKEMGRYRVVIESAPLFTASEIKEEENE